MHVEIVCARALSAGSLRTLRQTHGKGAGVVALALLTMSLYLSPSASAFTGWNVTFNGPLTGLGLTNSSVSGSCTFPGQQSGSSGSCSFTLTLQSSTFNFVCKVKVAVATWSAQPIQAGGKNGFWIDSGQLTAAAPGHKEASLCAQESVLPGTLGPTGAIVSPLDTTVVAAVGTQQKIDFGQIPGSITVVVSNY